MPRTQKIEWAGLSRGEDSATQARDPLSIPNGYCAVLDNIEPSSGRLKPRYGCSKLSRQGDRSGVIWMGEYQNKTNGHILWVDGGTLYARAVSGIEYVVRQDWLSTNCKVSSCRIGKYLVVLGDEPNKSLVVAEIGGKLTAFDTIINNDVLVLTSASQAVNISSESGQYLVGRPRMLSHTWVRLPSEMAAKRFTYAATDGWEAGMPSAQLESWEDINLRVMCKAATQTITTTTFSADDPFSVTPTTTTTTGTAADDSRGSVSVTFAAMTPPANATHLRVYMTSGAVIVNGNESGAETDASGSALRWAFDLPVASVTGSITIPGSEEALAGVTELAWSTGRDDIPPGGFVKFAGGRLWVGGGSAQMETGYAADNPGRVYASAMIDGSTDQLSRLLSFAYQTDYVDTSMDESQPCVGAGISQGGLVLFNSDSTWYLDRASLDYAPQQISSLGAIGAITEINQRIFFLSKSGPAVVSGSVLDMLKNFKNEDTTPGITNYSRFFRQNAKINGIYHNDSWIISDGEINAAYLMRGESEGTWRITPGEDISMQCCAYPSNGYCYVGGGNRKFYSLMQSDVVKDGVTPFLARMYTNGTATPKGAECGEAYSITTNTRWNDESAIKIVLNGSFGRIADVYGFVESTDSASATGPLPMQRGPVVQGVRAGAVSHWFQVGIEKYIWDRDTLIGGATLDLIPRDYHAESISISDPGRAEPILDAGYFGWEPQIEIGVEG